MSLFEPSIISPEYLVSRSKQVVYDSTVFLQIGSQRITINFAPCCHHSVSGAHSVF